MIGNPPQKEEIPQHKKKPAEKRGEENATSFTWEYH